MIHIDKIKIKVGSTIKDALSIIDDGAVKIALVVSEDGKLIGTLSDGDIRRGFLSGKKIDDTIESIFNKSPLVASIDESRENIIQICKSNKIYQIPIINEDGVPVSIDILDELLKPKVHPNKVILMVGGIGSRLMPLTKKTPKPMLHVGGKPILQIIIENFSKYGFVNITLCVNYQSHVIQDYFGDGSKFGVKIDYISESKKMGTAGALTLLKDMPTEPFFVMNGDLLTNANFEHFLEFHTQHKSKSTICVRAYDFQVPYGVVNIQDGLVNSIEEKPVHNFFVNAGIYILDPECISFVPKNSFYDMPGLLNNMAKKGISTLSFPLREYWLDIGKVEEYEKAQREFHHYFNS